MVSILHHPEYDAQTVSDDHRFPMRKYTALARYIERSGLVTSVSPFIEPQAADFAQLSAAHSEDYVRACLDLTLDARAQRTIGFELTAAVVMRSQLSCGGSLLAGEIALDEGIACNAAGGSHHAKREGGAGFCVFNDVGVAIGALKAKGLVRRALVIDCDVHQGDGTADIFADDPDVFTLSLHCEKNWPFRKVKSDLDVGLDIRTGDLEYLNALRRSVGAALEGFRPDIVYYNAGVDPHQDDRLGKLSLSDAGIESRDEYIVDTIREQGIPLVCVIGGGYSDDVQHLARLHGSVFMAADRAD